MRQLPAVMMVVFVLAGLSVSWSLIRANQPEPEKRSSESNNNNESAEVRYARAHLELAELDLRRAIERNKQIPDLLSAATIDELRRHVLMDQEQLNQHLMGENADLRAISIRGAEAAVEMAEADLQRKRAIHERIGNAASALDAERAGVVAKLARINLEKTRAQKTSESVLTHLQWQIDELRNQVLELQLHK